MTAATPSRTVDIPMSDLRAQYASLRDQIDAAIRAVLEGGEFERGEEIWALEREIGAYLGVPHVVPVGSGYAALFLALRGLGVGPGDEVITVPNTDIATCSAISHCGARIVWADVDERTFNIDPDAAERAIGPRTRAIVAVHLYGLPADLPRLSAIAARHGVALVEDAALALGATIGERRAGSIGAVSSFSFAPHKVLGAYGDGGMVTTADADLAARIRLLAGYGEPWRESMSGPDGRLTILAEGYHSHLDLLQAAVLRVKLRHVEGWIAARRSRAALYDELLADAGVAIPHAPTGYGHVYRSYVVRVPQRDRMREALAQRGIETALLYLPPLHLQPVYRSYGFGPGSFPVTERLADELLCLPLYPELPDDAVRTVARELRLVLADLPSKGAA
jgi:dTDP-4-amino-4,6-dideoxygalactose transaminase